MKTLGNLQKGRKAVVKTINPNGLTGQRLMALGLLPGTPVDVVQVAPLGDPIAIKFRGRQLSLRKAEADVVTIEAA